MRAGTVVACAILTILTCLRIPAAGSGERGAPASARATRRPAAAALAVQAPPDAAALDRAALLSRYCIGCHNQRTKAGGLTLDTMDIADVARDAKVWETVLRKLRAGVMPPPGMPRPDAARYGGFVAWLGAELDRAGAARPDPGRSEPMHRLNRAEYHNAVRDLLAVDVDPRLLPADDASYGFDNIAGVQRMSPTLLERYLTVAERTSRIAVGASPLAPRVETYSVPPDLSQDDEIEGLPFGTRGGMLLRHVFPRDGDYSFRVMLATQGIEENLPTFDLPQTLEISIDGAPVKAFTLPPASGGTPGSDRDWQVTVPVKAGTRDVVVTFLNRAPAMLENFIEPFLAPYVGGNTARYTTRRGAYLRRVEIAGPFQVTGVSETPSRRRIFVCRPADAAGEAACARTILSTLARRAYRRPVSGADVRALVGFYDQGRSDGGFDAGIERAVEALLSSPHFLFRLEHDPAGVAPPGPYRVSDIELASRLSFFLWSSIPDDELLDAAIRGQLARPAVLERQVRRMLADPRAEALVENFVSQWLFLRNVAALTPDPKKDPDFGETLRQAFRRETELFTGSILREDRSVLDLLTADYTFVNERLARHYGIPNVQGGHFRRVRIPDEHRRGLLGQGSILSITAFPHRTSPVLRGKWVLENLLGTPVPDPPPNVPPLDTGDRRSDEGLSMRERIARHRANPVCSSCHSMMDPPGLALENFDLLGRWRLTDESLTPIDASGSLPDGTTFTGPGQLRRAVLGRPDRFVETLTEKMLTYALGRGVEYSDMPTVRAIARRAAAGGYRASSLVLGIVGSVPFQMRRPRA